MSNVIKMRDYAEQAYLRYGQKVYRDNSRRFPSPPAETEAGDGDFPGLPAWAEWPIIIGVLFVMLAVAVWVGRNFPEHL